MSFDPEAFRAKLEERAVENRRAFDGLYKAEIEALLGLSRDELERIAPDTTPIEAYDQLLDVVKVASATNVSQAALRDRIVALGGVAVRIAGQVPTLATILR